MESASTKGVSHKLAHALKLDQLPAGVRKTLVAVIGGTVLLIGFALVFLPGPAILVIPIGLAILASEFAWARHYLHKLRNLLKRKNKRQQNEPIQK
jgi:hypothetical protein